MRKSLDLMGGYQITAKYSADENGVVYIDKPSKFHPSIIAGAIIKYFINKFGYVEYILRDSSCKAKHIQAHRIVASLFIPKIEGKEYVNHKDGDKLNNNVTNLEWCTASENEKHSYDVLNKVPWNKGKKLPSGLDYKGVIRPVVCRTLGGKAVKEYFNPTEAEQDGFCRKQISAVCNGSQKTHKGFYWEYKEKEK